MVMSKTNNFNSTIMFTDIVGYSAMINKNQNHALNLLSTHDSIIEPIISNYNGKIIKKLVMQFLQNFQIHYLVLIQQLMYNQIY